MNAEFSVAGTRQYNRSSPLRWILSHEWQYKWYMLGALIPAVIMNIFNAAIPALVGRAFDDVLENPPDASGLTKISVAILVIVLARGAFDLVARLCAEVCAKSLERDSRDELLLSLLGKSQTFHNRQRVGDLMARAANDVRQLNMMINPGFDLIFDSMTALVIPIIFIGLLDVRLLAVPLLFTVAFIFALRYYMQQLTPVSMEQRMSFAELNASLAESVQGIEVIKVTAQEQAERLKFRRGAQRFRDAFIRQGEVQAWYLPTLILAVAMAAGLLQGAWYVTTDRISVGQLVTYIGLLSLLRFPTMISTFSFALVQMGLVSARRILDLMAEHTELDENVAGIASPIKGKVEFDDVWFSYGSDPVLRGVSFVAEPGETIAIVGETGSGKTTLTKLVNRIYDPERGRILIDGIDVKNRSLDSLRSQISSIEQDIVLFSRPISENIGFSLGQQTDRAAIERAARDAQADTFIQELPEGYDTVIGERGVTLSGGQRQRLAIARALLTDPAILMLDDSTSAIDSATEDQIQRAIHRVLVGRTTFLITHRLSQIRWADRVLVLRKGEVVDYGTHDDLMHRCSLYQRIFGHYDMQQSEPSAEPRAEARSST